MLTCIFWKNNKKFIKCINWSRSYISSRVVKKGSRHIEPANYNKLHSSYRKNLDFTCERKRIFFLFFIFGFLCGFKVGKKTLRHMTQKIIIYKYIFSITFIIP